MESISMLNNPKSTNFFAATAKIVLRAAVKVFRVLSPRKFLRWWWEGRRRQYHLPSILYDIDIELGERVMLVIKMGLLITYKEARFAGQMINSMIAAGQNVSLELMDLAMKDGRCRSKREARKGVRGPMSLMVNDEEAVDGDKLENTKLVPVYRHTVSYQKRQTLDDVLKSQG